MNEDQKEAFDAVVRINEEIFTKYSKINAEDRMPIVSITFADVYMFIGISLPSTDTCELPEFKIYNSENNDRIYFEKGNKYETYYKFIKRKFKEFKEEIYSVKI